MVKTVTHAKHSAFMSLIVKCTIICIALENVKILSLAGAAIKPIHFVFGLAVVYCVVAKRVPIKHLALGAFFLVLPVFPVYRINDLGEWIKTYAIYAIICLFMTFAMRHFIEEFKRNSKKYVIMIVNTIAFLEVLGIIQFIAMNLFGIFLFQDFWGMFQFHHSQFGMSGNLYRAYSLFYEPSVFAWVINTSITICLFADNSILSKRIKMLSIVTSVAAILCTLTTTGIAITMVIFGVYLLTKSRNPVKIITSLVGAGLLVILIASFTDLLAPISRIFIEIQTPNTSGYERLVTPLLYVGETFKHFPLFGRGLGQEGEVDAVGIIGRYASIHNSIFGIIAWFGLSALCFYIPALIFCKKKIKENRRWVLLITMIIGIYISNGAFCSLDLYMFLVLIVAVGSTISCAQTEK